MNLTGPGVLIAGLKATVERSPIFLPLLERVQQFKAWQAEVRENSSANEILV